MKVHLRNNQDHLINIQRVNQSLARQSGRNAPRQSAKAERRDLVIITPQGRASSLLESLVKQKMSIADQKNSLIGATLKNGGTLDGIKPQLEVYEEQLKQIDSQIAEMMAKELENQAQKLTPKGIQQPKTEEERQNAELARLFGMSGDLRQVKTIRSVKAKIDGDSRVLRSEIAMDKARGGKAILRKEIQLAEMQQKSVGLTSKIADKLSDIYEQAASSHKPPDVVSKDEVADHQQSTSRSLSRP